MNDRYFTHLRKTFELANKAVSKGNHPFGSIMVLESGRIIEAENTVVEMNDPTQHAELRLVQEASRRCSPEELRRATLYASTEPCAMCAGAIFWAGVRHIVFGCSATRLEAIAGASFTTDCREVLKSAKESVRIEGPFLEDESAAIHEAFWPRSER